MTLEFSVDENPASFGNHFIIGLHGTTLSEEDKRVLSTVRPAGILLLSRNFNQNAPYAQWIEELRALLAQVREYTERDEIIVSLDHEGGRVMRTPPPITVFPHAATFGHRAAAVAEAHAVELRSLGVNLSWAPVADIHSNPLNPIIGERAFGTTAEQVIATAVPYATTLARNGVLGCAKHFPGHGDTTTDSHLELPVLDLSIAALRERELRPFKKLIDIDIPFIMTAHIMYPQIDAEQPATLSERIISDLLRGEMQFKRVIVTDDLDMKAVSDRFNQTEAVARTINIGCDMFIIARNSTEQSDRTEILARAIGRALVEHTIAEDTLWASFSRINSVFQDLLEQHEPHLLSNEVLTTHHLLARSFEEANCP